MLGCFQFITCKYYQFTVSCDGITLYNIILLPVLWFVEYFPLVSVYNFSYEFSLVLLFFIQSFSCDYPLSLFECIFCSIGFRNWHFILFSENSSYLSVMWKLSRISFVSLGLINWFRWEMINERRVLIERLLSARWQFFIFFVFLFSMKIRNWKRGMSRFASSWSIQMEHNVVTHSISEWATHFCAFHRPTVLKHILIGWHSLTLWWNGKVAI